MLAHVLAYAFYRIFLAIFELFRIFFGHSSPSDKGKSKDDEVCCESFPIWWRKRLALMEPATRYDFWCGSGTKILAAEIVTNEKWTLYTIDREFAYFVFLPNPLTSYCADKVPFFRVDQYLCAQKFARIRLDDFCRLGSLVGPPKGHVIFLTYSPRSGSTLLSQILQTCENVSVIAEPDVFSLLCSLFEYEQVWSEKEFLPILKSTLDLFCKNMTTEQTLVLKPRSVGTELVPFVRQLYPHIRQIFIYRQPKASLNSIQRTLNCELSMSPAFQCRRILPRLINTLLGMSELSQSIVGHFNAKDPFEFAFLLYAIPLAVYGKHKEDFDFALSYEELMMNPKLKIAQLFDACQVHASSLEEAVSVLETDSQRDTVLSRDSIGGLDTEEITEQRKQRLRILATRIGLADNFPAFE